MQLKFSTKFPASKPGLKGKETRFAEKIIKSLDNKRSKINADEFKTVMNWMVVNKKFDFPYYVALAKDYIGKIHTMREDKIGKWNEGDQIDMMMNDGLKEFFRLLPPVLCKGIQRVKIEYFMGCGNYPNLYVDGHLLSNEQYEQFTKNDGFDSVEDFCLYFDKDWKGKLIHWTNFKYNINNIEVNDAKVVCGKGCGRLETACPNCLKEFKEYKSKMNKS